MRQPIAANDNIHPDEPLRLADAVKYGFPHGGMTVSGLRRVAERGRLPSRELPTRTSPHFVPSKK
jgi:hypothetical protein